MRLLFASIEHEHVIFILYKLDSYSLLIPNVIDLQLLVNYIYTFCVRRRRF